MEKLTPGCCTIMMALQIYGASDQKMYFIKIYFILGLAMLLFVLWDFKYVPKTASRFVKLAGDKETGFALIVQAIRNLILMALLAFFLWPAIIWWEFYGEKNK